MRVPHGNTRLARTLRSIAWVVNLHSLSLCAVGCLAVYICEQLGLSFALDISLIVFGVTFSVTFTITQAYQRRERALTTIAELKASVIAMYWHHRDWAQGPGYPGSLGDDGSAWAQEFAAVATEYLESLERYINTPEGYESIAEVRLAADRRAVAHMLIGSHGNMRQDTLGLTFMERFQSLSTSLPGHPHLMRAYAALSKMSVMNEYLTHKAHYTRGGEGGMSRTAQYLRYLVAQMEQLRMIKIYRTPAMLRSACSLLTHALTVILAPYFVHVGKCDAGAEDAGFGMWCPAPYIMACLWVLITTLLLTVQESNEHPLDMTGVDDVFLNITEEFRDVLADARFSGTIRDDGSCFNQWRQQFDAKWRDAAVPADK